MVQVVCTKCGAGGAGDNPPYNCECGGKQSMLRRIPMKRFCCNSCGARSNTITPSRACIECGVDNVMIDDPEGLMTAQQLPLAPDPASAVIRMNPWVNETDPKIVRRVGKLGEEVAELTKVLFRIQIQGINGVDPASGKTNLQSLIEEVADVSVQCDLTIEHFNMDTAAMVERMERKRANMKEWEVIAPYA